MYNLQATCGCGGGDDDDVDSFMERRTIKRVMSKPSQMCSKSAAWRRCAKGESSTYMRAKASNLVHRWTNWRNMRFAQFSPIYETHPLNGIYATLCGKRAFLVRRTHSAPLPYRKYLSIMKTRGWILNTHTHSMWLLPWGAQNKLCIYTSSAFYCVQNEISRGIYNWGNCGKNMRMYRNVSNWYWSTLRQVDLISNRKD